MRKEARERSGDGEKERRRMQQFPSSFFLLSCAKSKCVRLKYEKKRGWGRKRPRNMFSRMKEEHKRAEEHKDFGNFLHLPRNRMLPGLSRKKIL